MKNVAVLTEDGVFAPFFRPYPGGFDSLRVPATGNLPAKAKKKMLMPGDQPGGGGGLGTAGIDWCITRFYLALIVTLYEAWQTQRFLTRWNSVKRFLI